MPTTKDQTLKVRVNPASDGASRDEVLVESNADEKGNYPEPYINRAIYAKPGLFKDGELSVDEVLKLEERSNKALQAEYAALVQETKAREAADAAAVVKPDTAKKEEATVTK